MNYKDLEIEFEEILHLKTIVRTLGMVKKRTDKHTNKKPASYSIYHIQIVTGLVWFVGFYDISTFVVYLMPNPFLCN